MELIISYYLLFASSISISSCLLWFWPLIAKARQAKITNSFTQYPKTSTTVYVLTSALVAPLLLFPMFSDEMAERFVTGLSKEMLKPDQEFNT